MQSEPTRSQNPLDLFCCNKLSLVKTCISIPGIIPMDYIMSGCTTSLYHFDCVTDTEL